MTYNVFGGTSSIQSIGCDAQLGGNVPVGEEKEMSGDGIFQGNLSGENGCGKTVQQGFSLWISMQIYVAVIWATVVNTQTAFTYTISSAS